jgi:hypothetical protein
MSFSLSLSRDLRLDLEWWSAAQQQMVNIQNKPAPMLNAAASQVVARKEVLMEALTP